MTVHRTSVSARRTAQVAAALLLACAGLCACAGGGSAVGPHDRAGAGGVSAAAGAGSGPPAGAGGSAGMLAGSGGSAAGTGGDPSGGGGGAGAGGTGAAGGMQQAGAGGMQQAGAGGMAGGAVIPVQRDGRYAIEVGDLSLEVDPQLGGRVTRFALAGRDVLTTAAVHAENWGSTFWPSPQSAWGWPPPVEIDSAPYEASVDGETLVLEGTMSSAVGLRVTKRLRGDSARQAIVMEFVLHNVGSEAASFAHWQISRVPAGGLTFFPTGTKTGAKTELNVQPLAGVTWYAHDFTAITAVDGQKHIADGAEGWLAHAHDRLLFVKSFADVAPDAQHPSEGEIEIYANKADDASRAYVEVECQGPLDEIAPGGTLAWTVTWYLREVPADIAVEAGSESLAAFARMLVR